MATLKRCPHVRSFSDLLIDVECSSKPMTLADLVVSRKDTSTSDSEAEEPYTGEYWRLPCEFGPEDRRAFDAKLAAVPREDDRGLASRVSGWVDEVLASRPL